MTEISEGVNAFVFAEKEGMCNFEKWIFVFICPLDKWYLPFVSEQKGDIGFVMETWHGPAVPYTALTQADLFIFLFLPIL